MLDISASQLKIARPSPFDDIQIGSSICVLGVCLSVVAFDDDSMTFDVVGETWERSNLGNLMEGSPVNLERSMTANSRLDGHIVQGHVEGVGLVVEEGLSVQLPQELIKNCVQKGSIALNGVSLTISNIEDDVITVALVPHTIESTTLGTLEKGDSVNVETDVLQRKETSGTDDSWRIGIVASQFYKEEIDTLVNGAINTLLDAGIPTENITVHQAAGSFEVPLIGAALAEGGNIDALIGLGIIIDGETHHAKLLAESTAAGMMEVQVRYTIPFAFEILYVDSMDIARRRLHKGEEAARSVLQSLAKLRSVRS